MSQAGWVIKTEQAARHCPGSGWYGSAISCAPAHTRGSPSRQDSGLAPHEKAPAVVAEHQRLALEPFALHREEPGANPNDTLGLPTPTSPRPGRAEMPQSAIAAAALSPQLVIAAHPCSFGLLAAADELARRTGEMREEDVTFAMECVRDAPETSGEHGAIRGMQYHGGRGADAAAASCHKAGWSMGGAARHLADSLAARGR